MVTNDHGFLATVSSDNIGLTARLLQSRRDETKRPVALGMSIHVVVKLEVVDVDQNDADSHRTSSAASTDVFPLVVQISGVANAGESVFETLAAKRCLLVFQQPVFVPKRGLAASRIRLDIWNLRNTIFPEASERVVPILFRRPG